VIHVPQWFDDLFRGEPIKLSANWRRDPANPRKAAYLNKLAVVPNPRISDAAMMSALFAAEAGDRNYPPPFATFGRQAMNANAASAADLNRLFFFLHDHLAAHGAKCQNLEGHGQLPHSQRAGHLEDYGAHGNDRELILRSAAGLSASFGAGPDTAGVQKMHDLLLSLLGSGAACSQWRLLMSQGGGISTPSYAPGQYLAAATQLLPAFRDYRPGQFYSSGGSTQRYSEPQSVGLSNGDYDLDAEAARLAMGGEALNAFGQFAFSEPQVQSWMAEAASAAADYADRRNRELSINPWSGSDQAAH
jgi:hypothetical protein